MKLITLTLLTLWSVGLSAQSLTGQDKTDIQSRLDEYFEFTKANNYSQMMDYVYPKVFTLATKEQMVEVFNSLETMGIGLNVDEININKIEDLMDGGDKKYGVADYKIDIRLKLLTPVMQSAEVIESLKSSFKVSYNASDMSYDEEAKTLSFKGHKYVLAIKDPDYDADNWYFLEYDASNPMAAQMLLDGDVLAKFKEKMAN